MTRASPELPYWRLSSFYFFYFAVVGALFPYWGPYLRFLGFNEAQIGELIAILNLSRIVAPSLWGSLADRLGRRMPVVRLASLVALGSFLGVFLGSGYWWLVLVMCVFSFFWNAALPQFEAVTLNHLSPREHLYSQVRLWGSVGFILAVVALGELVRRYGEGLVPYAVALMFAAMWLTSLLAPEKARPAGASAQQEGFWRTLRRPPVLGLLLACLLTQASHGPYYAFFSIYLQELGYGLDRVGLLWAWGVVAEVAVFLVIHRWLPRFGPRWLMTLSLLLAALRWCLIGAFSDSLVLLFLAQTLHAASFGVYHAVGIAIVSRWFQGRAQGRGQAVYSMTFGAGVAVGSLVSGYLWIGMGGERVFLLAALAAAVAAGLAWWSVPARLTPEPTLPRRSD